MRKKIVALSVASALGVAHSAQAAEKPNVLFLMVDNWGWGDISSQGGQIPTPEIDKVAEEGIRFLNYNVQNQCTPSRAAMHTGRLPIRSGTYKVPILKGAADGLAPWEYTIAEMLSDDGYKTALYGKWHIGSVDGRLPIDQGYDDWYGYRGGSDEAGYTSSKDFDPSVAEVPYIWQGTKGGKPEKVKEFNLDTKKGMDAELVDKTIEFINQSISQDKPFYTYVGFTTFHSPYTVSDEFKGKSKKGTYADTQLELDHNIGRLMTALKQSGQLDNTIVIIAGDNGSGNIVEGKILKPGEEPLGSNGPWRGGLSTAFEGGMRTPAVVRYGNKVEAGQVTDEIISDLDWFSTLAHLTGNEDKIPADRPIDSIDQSDFILGNSDKSNRNYVLTYVNDELFAVKWNNYKMHFKVAYETHGRFETLTFPLIYDLERDPGEQYEIWANEGYQHSWLVQPIGKIIAETARSMHQYPNIPTGADFKGYSAKK
ncbi:arylsulfatase [Vibrio campbellii]|uniref:arylsulfatase n=1 Tax=Vibrio campbellii TaxID=680 RepID=UPI00097FBC3C|nr:arylsulfatase [Vibrio campbellii]AQM69895.1 Arylsulfatase precursor [Vibrio campbellii]